MSPKKGRLSQADRDYIRDNRRRQSVEQMAAYLRRAPAQVRRHIDEELGGMDTAVSQEGLSLTLENRPEWAIWQDQFSQDELKYFKYKYLQLVGQFGQDDILPTEEMQLFSLIQNEILAARTLKEQRKISQEMDYVQGELERLYEERKAAKDTTARKSNRVLTDELEKKYAEISSAQKGVTARYEAYQMRNTRILESLKATRDQRVKVIEGSKQSFLGLLKSLMQEDFRSREGEQMEMVRLAANKERDRLAAPHKYADGALDQPLLTPETVLETYDRASTAIDEDAPTPAPDEESAE